MFGHPSPPLSSSPRGGGANSPNNGNHPTAMLRDGTVGGSGTSPTHPTNATTTTRTNTAAGTSAVSAAEFSDSAASPIGQQKAIHPSTGATAAAAWGANNGRATMGPPQGHTNGGMSLPLPTIATSGQSRAGGGGGGPAALPPIALSGVGNNNNNTITNANHNRGNTSKGQQQQQQQRRPRSPSGNSSNDLNSVGSHFAPTTIVREPNGGAAPQLPLLPTMGPTFASPTSPIPPPPNAHRRHSHATTNSNANPSYPSAAARQQQSQPSVSSHTSNGGAGVTGGRRTAGTTSHGMGQTSFDAVTTFDLENDRDCPPAINTNAAALQRGKVYGTTTAGSTTGSNNTATTATAHVNMSGGANPTNPNPNLLTPFGGAGGPLRRSMNTSSFEVEMTDKVINSESVVVAVGSDGGGEGGIAPPFLTNNFTLPPIAVEEKGHSAYHYHTESSTAGGGGRFLGQGAGYSVYPLSARSTSDQTGTRARRHVTVHAPSDHDGDYENGGMGGMGMAGIGGGMGGGGSVHRYGQTNAGTTLWSYYGAGGSEGIFGIPVGGITDDHYFGSEGPSRGVDPSNSTSFMGASYASRGALGGSVTGVGTPLWRTVIAFFLHPMITATVAYGLVAAYSVARMGVEFNYFRRIWVDRGEGTPFEQEVVVVNSTTTVPAPTTTMGNITDLFNATAEPTSSSPSSHYWDATRGLPYVRSGALWAGAICVAIVLSFIAHCCVLVGHRLNSQAEARAAARQLELQQQVQREKEAAEALLDGTDGAAAKGVGLVEGDEGGLMGGSASSLPSFNNSANTIAGRIRHNRAPRISVTVAYAIISLLLVALSIVEGLTGGAQLLALLMPLVGSCALRPILSTRIISSHALVCVAGTLAATVLLSEARRTNSHNDGLESFFAGAMGVGFTGDYPLPIPDRLWLRFAAYAVLAVGGIYVVLAQHLRGDPQTHRLAREQATVALILRQLVDLNVESAKRCLDEALAVNPVLGDGQHAAFNAATKLINGLTVFRSYVPTAVGGLSEDFSSDDESIPEEDEDLTGLGMGMGGGRHGFGQLRSTGSAVHSSSNGQGQVTAINVSAAALTPRAGALGLGPMTPKLQPAAPQHSSGHPIPAPLEAHFGVKTTFRKRWVTIVHMHISPPASGLDTTLAEAIGNAVCGPVVDTVTAHRGVVEHLGPMSIVISFNCRVPCVMHETEACRVASSIAEDLAAILPPEIRSAVIVASGYCIVGDFGVDTHRAKVIIGDAMDIVMRVPPLAIRLGAKVVLTEDTASRIAFDYVPIDNILIGGLNAESRLAGGAGITHSLTGGGAGRSVILYELRSVAKVAKGAQRSADSTLFASGFSAFRCGEFASAADRFRRYCATNEGDGQAQRILELSNWFALNGVAMGPRTYLRREVAWELFEGEIDPTRIAGANGGGVGAGGGGGGYTALDVVQSLVPPSPRLNGSIGSITPSMRSRQSSSRDVSEMVRQQIMSNPYAAPSLAGGNPKLEFQEEGGLLGMFILPDDNDDDDEVVAGGAAIDDGAALAAAGLDDLIAAPSPPSGVYGNGTAPSIKAAAISGNEGGGPSSSRKGGGSTITPNTNGSVNYNLSVVNGMATNSNGRTSVLHNNTAAANNNNNNTHNGGQFNQSVNSVMIQQPSMYTAHGGHFGSAANYGGGGGGGGAQPFLDPHEEMLLLSSEIPLEFFDSSGNRWKRAGTKLGSGAGGAEVFLALGEQGNLVALKCFSLASTKTDQEELIHEVGTLSRLRDDFIVGYVSYAITAHHFIILMEYISGGSLYQLLEQFGPMPLSTARRFMTDILKGLRYLHEERTTHCDIKPHNALLSTEGNCKLTDFGSCMPLEALGRGMPDDMPLVRGTSWYLAPEAARGEVELANDIWSLGVTLIELLTGSHPWQGREYSSLNEMAFIIKLGKDPKMVPPIPNTIDGTAREFITMCLQRDPKERPTVAELQSHPFIIS